MFYKNANFGARLAYNSRGAWTNNGGTDYRLGTSRLNESAYYNLTDNFKLTLSAVNILRNEFVRRLRASKKVFDHGLLVSDIATNWTSHECNGRQIFAWRQRDILAGEILAAFSPPFPPGWTPPSAERGFFLKMMTSLTNHA